MRRTLVSNSENIMTHPPASKNLVTTEWLAERLGKPDVAIVDGSFYLPALKRDAKAEYLAAHIPGAAFFDIDAIADNIKFGVGY